MSEHYKDFQNKTSNKEQLTGIEKGLYKTRIDLLNELFSNENLVGLSINTDYEFEQNDYDDSYRISNYYFVPTHKVLNHNGLKEEHIGYRFDFVKLTKKGFIKIVSLNLSILELDDAKWLSKVDLGKGFELYSDKMDVKGLTKALLKITGLRRMIFTSSLGWLKVNELQHYIPITNGKDDEIVMSKGLSKEYNITFNEALIERDSVIEMLKLQRITDRTTTTVLLSFTILASVQSLIKQHSSEMSEFMLCIHSNDDNHSKTILANLFCNIFNRSKHIYTLDAKFHVNQSTKEEIREKSTKIKDAVFINRVNGTKNISSYMKQFGFEGRNNRILFVSNSSAENDAVINLNVETVKLDKEILEYHQKTPDIFSTWYTYFMKYLQSNLQEKTLGLDNKRNITKRYDECYNALEDNQLNCDGNKLRHYAWLLFGYQLYLEFALEVNAIDKQTYSDLYKEAIRAFQEYILIGNTTGRVHDLPSDQVKEDSLLFVSIIDKTLNDQKLNEYGDNTNVDGILGWIDSDKLYLKNKELQDKINESKISTNIQKIYQFLHKQDIIIEKPKNGWGVQVTAQVKAVRYSIKNMKQFLIDNGCTLNYLNEK